MPALCSSSNSSSSLRHWPSIIPGESLSTSCYEGMRAVASHSAFGCMCGTGPGVHPHCHQAGGDRLCMREDQAGGTMVSSSLPSQRRAGRLAADTARLSVTDIANTGQPPTDSCCSCPSPVFGISTCTIPMRMHDQLQDQVQELSTAWPGHPTAVLTCSSACVGLQLCRHAASGCRNSACMQCMRQADQVVLQACWHAATD